MGQARTYKDSSGASHFSTPGAWREDFGFQRDHKVFGETKGKSVVANRVWWESYVLGGGGGFQVNFTMTQSKSS